MIARLNSPLLLLALVAAIGIKLVVHGGSEQTSTRTISVPVTYTTPSEDVISYDTVDTVRVGLRGPRREIEQLSMFNAGVTVDIPADQTGPFDIVLGPDNVNTSSDLLEVSSIEPNRFTIQVEPRMVAQLPVRVVLAGEPAAGARHGEPAVRPPYAQVSGPASKVRRLSTLAAEVRLDGHARSFTETVPLVSPDPVVKVLEPTRVEVEVPMTEPQLNISVDDLRQESQPS